MHVAVLDTNVLRGLPSGAFAALVAAESRLGVGKYADAWTMMELMAHLDKPSDLAYRASRLALRKCVERASAGPGSPPQIVTPSELQISRLVFGDLSEIETNSIAALLDVARLIAEAEDVDDLSSVSHAIHAITRDVQDKEEWFARYFADLRQQINDAATGVSKSERNAVVRNHIQAENLMWQDALALIARAYKQRGLTMPSDLPEDLVPRVHAAARTSSYAVAVLLERILCDGASLDQSRIRNLLWDQEMAASIGQTVGGLPVKLVTNDSFFRDAASRAGHGGDVLTPAQYADMLGITLV